MQTLKTFTDQAVTIWKESTAAARIGIILLLITCVVCIVGVGIWSAQPNYVILAENLAPDKAQSVVNALSKAGIDYRLDGAGSIVKVDQPDFDKAVLATGDLGIIYPTVQLEQSSPWMDPASQQKLFQRNLELQLAESIRQIQPIERAIVHLAIPERRPFVPSQELPTASVILHIPKSVSRLPDSTTANIASLVANAVTGLSPDRVAISDNNGNEYSTDRSFARLTSQEQHRAAYELDQVIKAESILQRTLGPGNATVAISAQFNFKDTQRRVRTVEKGVPLEEESMTTTTKDGATLAMGAAGSASNLPSISTDPGSRNGSSEMERINTRYEVPVTEMTETVHEPELVQQTISVLVNAKPLADENGQLPADVEKTYGDLVKQAVGYEEGRDRFTIQFLEFQEPTLPEPSALATLPWDQINNVLKNISLGLAALVALLIGMKIIKRIQPAPVPGGATAAGDADRNQRITALSDLVKENPEVFARIIEAWSNQPLDEEPHQNEQRRAA